MYLSPQWTFCPSDVLLCRSYVGDPCCSVLCRWYVRDPCHGCWYVLIRTPGHSPPWQAGKQVATAAAPGRQEDCTVLTEEERWAAKTSLGRSQWPAVGIRAIHGHGVGRGQARVRRSQARDRRGQGSEGRGHGSCGHVLGERGVHGWRVEVIRRLAFHGRRESRCRWPRAAAPRRPETKVLIGFSFW